MDRCHYCKWSEGRHDEACPVVTKKTDDYERGRSDGCSRSPAEPDANSTYELGYTQGDAAADTSENGERVWGC